MGHSIHLFDTSAWPVRAGCAPRPPRRICGTLEKGTQYSFIRYKRLAGESWLRAEVTPPEMRGGLTRVTQHATNLKDDNWFQVQGVAPVL
jgi:hypothetical protein